MIREALKPSQLRISANTLLVLFIIIMQVSKKQLAVAAIQFLRENGYTAGGRRKGEVSGEQASFENRQIRVPTGRLTSHPKKRG